jgi:hypothetical protein
VKATLVETKYDLPVLTNGIFVKSMEIYFTDSSEKEKI